MRIIRNVGMAMTLCLVFILYGCANIKDPNDYIKQVYPEYEELTKIEADGEQIRLLKSQDQYELVRLKKSVFTYAYNGGHKTNAPYGLNTLYTDNNLHITVFIDNSVVKANRFEVVLNSLNQEDITMSYPDLLKLDNYIIKTYDIPMKSNEIESTLLFYDKDDNLIPLEQIPLLAGS